MKKKIATLMVTFAMAGALFAGPALAEEHYRPHDVHWSSSHHPRHMHFYRPGYMYSYRPSHWYRSDYWDNPMMRRPVSHWRLIGGHWRRVRG